jgi:hypothetical protein
MDDFFNHEVAQWITKSMSGMDPDEAQMFAQFFVYEVHKQDIENNRRTLDRHVEEVQKSLMDDLQPALREEVSKRMVIRKDDWDTNWEELHHAEQPRGKGGKWVRIGATGPSVHYERGKGPKSYAKPRQQGEERPGIDVTGALNRTGKAGSSFAERWTEQGPNDHRTNERTYRRVAAGAELLGHLPGEHAKLASQVGQFAGQFGPEAEKVIGPAARRTAYRYRGTEREPDKQLARYHEQAKGTLRKRTFSDRDFNRVGGTPELTDEQNMAAAEDASVGYLVKRLPSKRLADLQLNSGKIPPSEGVIINSEGEIVTQAVGYQEDHYLPFNLKNLKGLKGGAYVRTRSSGGLTSEDIYTGLVGGARSVTVVSRSGVFTLDFDDHLRGGRRYSDKARQMVGRYAQTLDAVKSGKVAQRKLTPGERGEIRDDVETELEGQGYSKTEIEAKIAEREREFMANPRLTKGEIQDIEDAAVQATHSYDASKVSPGSERMPSDPKLRYKAYYSDMYDQAMEGKSKRMYQLDADGYEAAMQALQEQFPYFVQRVEVKKIPRGAGEKDTGYVRPNYNRPEAAREGYYDPKIQGLKGESGKFSASEMHYQNARHQGPSEVHENAAEGETKVEANAPKGQRARDARERVADEERRNAAVGALATEAARIWTDIDAEERDSLKMLAKFKANPDLELFSTAEVSKLMDELDHVTDLAGRSKESEWKAIHASLDDLRTTAKKAEGRLQSRNPFDQSTWDPSFVNPHPQRWAKVPAHSPDAENPQVYAQEWNRALQEHELGKFVSPNDNDDILRAHQTRWSRANLAARKMSENPGDEKSWTELETSLTKVGMGDTMIEDLRTEVFDKGNKAALAKVVENTEKKAKGLIRLRSVKAAAGDAPLTGPSTPPAGSVVQSQVVARTEKLQHGKSPHETEDRSSVDVDALIKDMEVSTNHPDAPQDHKNAVKAVRQAFAQGSSAEQMAAVEKLPSIYSHASQALMRHISQAPISAKSQLSDKVLDRTAADVKGYIKTSQLSTEEAENLKDLASAIEYRDHKAMFSAMQKLPKGFEEDYGPEVETILRALRAEDPDWEG